MKRSRATPPADPHALALRLLATRELSASQLRDRLARRGVEPPAIDRTIDRLSANGTLDDRRVARALARTHAEVKGRGRVRIAQELRAAGIDAATAKDALDEAFGDLDEAALLERALRKRLRGPLTGPAHLRRLHAALVRLGFAPAMVARALVARARDMETDE